MAYILRTPKLLPVPKKALWGDGFLEWEKAEFQIDGDGLACGKFVKTDYAGGFDSEEAYRLSINGEGISIEAASVAGAKAALQTLRQIGMQADSRGFRFCEIYDYPDIPVRAFALDASFGCVPTSEYLGILADRLSLFKYNMLELNVSNAYPFRGRESEWAGKGTFSEEKIAVLKRRCKLSGMELACRFDLSGGICARECAAEVVRNFEGGHFNLGDVSERLDVEAKLCAEFGSFGSPALYSAKTRLLRVPEVSDLPKWGIPVFSSGENALLVGLCESAFAEGRKFFVSAEMDAAVCPEFDLVRQKIDAACAAAKKFSAAGAIFGVPFGGGAFFPFCAAYPAIAHAAASMWGKAVPEEAVCNVLDAIVFYDSSGDFARALCALGRVDSSRFVDGMFGVSEEDVRALASSYSAADLDVIEGAADFAMGLAASSNPESRDAAVLSAEFALAGAMAKWAAVRARSDISTESDAQKTALKFIVSDFEKIWAATCEIGGLWKASSRIRSVKPEIF